MPPSDASLIAVIYSVGATAGCRPSLQALGSLRQGGCEGFACDYSRVQDVKAGNYFRAALTSGYALPLACSQQQM